MPKTPNADNWLETYAKEQGIPLEIAGDVSARVDRVIALFGCTSFEQRLLEALQANAFTIAAGLQKEELVQSYLSVLRAVEKRVRGRRSVSGIGPESWARQNDLTAFVDVARWSTPLNTTDA